MPTMKDPPTEALPPDLEALLGFNEDELQQLTAPLADNDLGPTRKRGRPPFRPTDEHRRQVQAMAKLGLRIGEVCLLLGLSRPTVRRYFSAELELGLIQGHATNLRRLTLAAAKGSVAAMVWLDRTRFARVVTGEADASDRPALATTGKKIGAAQRARTAEIGTEWEGILQ